MLLKIEPSEITPFFYNNFFDFGGGGGGNVPCVPPWRRLWYCKHFGLIHNSKQRIALSEKKTKKKIHNCYGHCEVVPIPTTKPVEKSEFSSEKLKIYCNFAEIKDNRNIGYRNIYYNGNIWEKFKNLLNFK